MACGSFAGTITQSVNPTVSITGTATVTTMNGGWVGRVVRLVKTDTGSLTIGGGGNVPDPARWRRIRL